MKSLLIKCLGNEEHSEELSFLKDNYTEDSSMPNFEAQLLLFKDMMPREEYTCFEDVYRACRKVDSANKHLVSEAEILKNHSCLSCYKYCWGTLIFYCKTHQNVAPFFNEPMPL